MRFFFKPTEKKIKKGKDSASDIIIYSCSVPFQFVLIHHTVWKVTTLLEKNHKPESKLYQKQHVFTGSGIIFTSSSIILLLV